MNFNALEMELRKTGQLSVPKTLELIEEARRLKAKNQKLEDQVENLEKWEDRFQALSEVSSSALEEAYSTLEEYTGLENNTDEMLEIEEDFPPGATATGKPNKSFEKKPTRKTKPYDLLK